MLLQAWATGAGGDGTGEASLPGLGRISTMAPTPR
jgi:hypothetical protein